MDLTLGLGRAHARESGEGWPVAARRVRGPMPCRSGLRPGRRGGGAVRAGRPRRPGFPRERRGGRGSPLGTAGGDAGAEPPRRAKAGPLGRPPGRRLGASSLSPPPRRPSTCHHSDRGQPHSPPGWRNEGLRRITIVPSPPPAMHAPRSWPRMAATGPASGPYARRGGGMGPGLTGPRQRRPGPNPKGWRGGGGRALPLAG